MSDIIVVYHQNCHDGFSSAWVAWKKFKNRAEYFGISYANKKNSWPLNVSQKTFYFLDVTSNLEKIKILKQNHNKVVLIDHHLSSQTILPFVDESYWDTRHAACVLAWHYFFPHKKVPRLLRYVEDEDLWRWKLVHSREIMSYVKIVDFDFKQWQLLTRKLENTKKRQEVIKLGKAIYSYKKKIIDSIVAQAQLVRFRQWKVLAVSIPFMEMISEVGNELVMKQPPLSIVYFQNSVSKKVSLRSNGKVNVAKIAEEYGGGGHYKSASFILSPQKPWPWQVLNS